MLAILIFLNTHNLLIFQPILMTFVSKFMFQKALSDKTYLSLGLLSPLNEQRLLKNFILLNGRLSQDHFDPSVSHQDLLNG